VRTRQKERDTPGPSEPWNEIVPGLWMGGHYHAPPGGEPQPVVARREFDLVVSLFTRSGPVRERRSAWALNNPVFVEYLNTGLGVSALLTGLDG
jgi:hypothetical protein